MNSVELYRHLRSGLAEWFRGRGFKRAPRAQLGWHREAVFVWFQCDKWGWDQYAGSSFFVNFQVGGLPVPWSAPTERLQHFLADGDLEIMRSLQNEVIRKLRMPPLEYIQAFKAACSKSADADDIQNWVAFLIGVLPPIVDELYRQASRPTSEGR